MTKEEFEQIYNLYIEQMLIICHNKINDKEIAKEIVQDIFKSLWERKDNLIITGPIKHYLLRATKFEIIDYFRKQSRNKKYLELSLKEEAPLYSQYNTEDELNYNELESLINYLIDKLPKRCREVYTLGRKRGLTNKEIASRLAISIKTVESHMTKALRFLKTNLKEYRVS